MAGASSNNTKESVRVSFLEKVLGTSTCDCVWGLLSESSDKCIYLNPVGKEKRRYNQTHTVTLCCSIDKNTFFTYYVQSIEVLATTNEHPPRVANFATHRWPWDLAARAIHATAGWKPGFLGSVAAVKKQNGKTGLGMWEQKTGVIPYNARPTGTSAQMIGSRSDWRVGVLDVHHLSRKSS